jgi:calcium-translocating P-type ATPase
VIQSGHRDGQPPPDTAGQGLDPTLDVTHLAAADLALGQTWTGLTSREAERRAGVFGPNALPAAPASRWWRDVVAQLTHPLALLLWVAAALAWWSGTPSLTVAILVVILLNAAFAVVQERQAERSVDAISAYIPQSAMVWRDGRPTQVPSELLVPGDLVTIVEGDRVCADARIVAGTADVDLSMLTGESVPVERGVERHPNPVPLLQARHVVLSGTSVVAGEVRAVVYATGTHTQIGQIASLTRGVRPDPSPLERQVRRVAWILAAVAVGVGLAFVPLGLVAGLTWQASVVFAIGLLVANVPEGLLPTITLALATGVRRLARHGAVVKRLSAVETLGSTSTICTDKTGTLTRNEMHVREIVAPDGNSSAVTLAAAIQVMRSCHQVRQRDGALTGDPTEVALVEEAIRTGGPFDLEAGAKQLVATFRFDPLLRRMTVVVDSTRTPAVRCKGAVESILALCRTTLSASGERELDAASRAGVLALADTMARRGLRVLALADRELEAGGPASTRRQDVEQQLRLVALVGLMDPPRPDVAQAVAQCHRAGIRVHVVTGDHPATATAIAEEVGVRPTRTIDASELDGMDDTALDALMASGAEVVFARSSPQAKLRIAEAARAVGQVVAMTGDGVNDAPALRAADIGVAMGRSGTDVAREAANMVLSDDNFATIVTAVESGRRVYANIRKFILYIFAHAVPEVVPFLLFALSGGSIPLGLTVMQILAIDLGTETLPALALGSERAEPGLMAQPPRPQHEQIIRGGLLWRAWGVLGLTSALLSTGAFLLVLHAAGWTPGDPVSPGSPLHHAYLQATSVTFLAIVLCQVGTAFAARTDHASLRSIGILTNRPLLWGIGFELLVAAAVVYLPFLQPVFHTAAPQPASILPLLGFPFVVWAADETWRAVRRRRTRDLRPESDPRSREIVKS